MRDSQRYEAQEQLLLKMAAKAESPAEKDVYLNIAEGWRRLAAEAARNERQHRPAETRSFMPDRE